MTPTRKIQPVINETTYQVLIDMKDKSRMTNSSIVDMAIREYAEKHYPEKHYFDTVAVGG